MCNVDKLPHITTRRNRDGTLRHYFRRRGMPPARLPDPASPLFRNVYEEKLDESNGANLALSERAQAGYRQYWAELMWRGARYRPNRQCTLSVTDIEAMMRDQGDLCAVSGIRFNYRRHNEQQDPLSPSLDRIDSYGEYTADNCRVVLLAVNVGLNRWGDKVFHRICKAVARRLV